jgi:hypothetical protein
MTNKKYGKKYYDDDESYYFLELTEWLFYILQNKPKLEKNCRMQKKKFPYEKENIINYEKNFWRKLLSKHEKIVDDYAEIYLRLYPNLRNFYSIFKKEPIKHNNEISAFLLKIENHFALDHPQKYEKLTGWCSAPEFILPKKDILEILGCKTREDYFKFLKEKLK